MEQVNIDVNPGNEFFADDVGVIHNPVRVILDFKSITPRIDRPNQAPRVIMKHNLVMMDPFVAKDFLKILTENLKKYEEKFGKIEKPKSLIKAEKDSKKKKKSKQLPPKADYFG